MASIIKRKKNYSIVYTYVDENGETKQKWETRSSYQDALKRKAEESENHPVFSPAQQSKYLGVPAGLRLPLRRKAVGRFHV